MKIKYCPTWIDADKNILVLLDETQLCDTSGTAIEVAMRVRDNLQACGLQVPEAGIAMSLFQVVIDENGSANNLNHLKAKIGDFPCMIVGGPKWDKVFGGPTPIVS